MLTWPDVPAFVASALAVSAASVTLTKSRATAPLRAKLERSEWLEYLVNCPYCTSHWLALLAAVPFGWRWYGIHWFALVSLAALLTGLSIRLLHQNEHDLNRLRDENARLRDAITAAGVDPDEL